MKSNYSNWSFKHEFYPSTFSAMMIEAECQKCKHLSYFVAKGFDQSANYCSYCGALNAATRWADMIETEELTNGTEN